MTGDDPRNRALTTLRRLTLAGFLLAILVVMLGAWTRLVDAGLGCPDWPGCYGFLHVPQSEAHIAQAEARFPGHRVEVEKGWPEMIHRYFAGTLGLVVFALAFQAWRFRRQGTPLKLPLALAVIVIIQALFGMWTVTLKLWPQVVTAHLLGGFTTLSLLFLLFLRLRVPRQPDMGSPGLRRALVLCLVLVTMQITLGAWTASNYAAVACTELPTCQGQWWPPMDFAHGFNIFQAVGPNYLGGQLTSEGRVAIHVMHRLGAILVLLVVGATLLALFRQVRGSGLETWVALSGALLGLQILLGIGNILFQVPVAMAVAHNAGGAALLLSLIHLYWRLYPSPPVEVTARWSPDHE